MIQTETTPNPNSLKFLSEKIISTIGTEEFQKNNAKDLKNPFIKELLEFNGVELVLVSKNFLSVKKNDKTSWNELKPMVISHLNHYFENNECHDWQEKVGTRMHMFKEREWLDFFTKSDFKNVHSWRANSNDWAGTLVITGTN